MLCPNCGKEINAGMNFCPYCGMKDGKDEKIKTGNEKDLEKKGIVDDNQTSQGTNALNVHSKGVNIIKGVIALVIGYVLSVITLFLLVKWKFLVVILFVIIFIAVFSVLRMMFGLIIGLFGGGLGTLLINSLIYKWAEVVDDASSWIVAFLWLTPLAILYAAILWGMDKGIINKSNTNSNKNNEL
ncbi:MAG: zinc ribbon domain-containing protein [Schwartzia succinivorans]|nr:zinc ribbon domain-containing protein [Schwartzia succinivorans]